MASEMTDHAECGCSRATVLNGFHESRVCNIIGRPSPPATAGSAETEREKWERCASALGGRIVDTRLGTLAIEGVSPFPIPVGGGHYFDTALRDRILVVIDGAKQAPPADFVDVVFDGPPGHKGGRFVECEDANGRSVSFEWINRGGLWALRIPARMLIRDLLAEVQRLKADQGTRDRRIEELEREANAMSGTLRRLETERARAVLGQGEAERREEKTFELRLLAERKLDEMTGGRSVSEVCESEARLQTQLDAVLHEIRDYRYMDPPDGGDVSLSEMVRRMWADSDALRAIRTELATARDELSMAHANFAVEAHGYREQIDAAKQPDVMFEVARQLHAVIVKAAKKCGIDTDALEGSDDLIAEDLLEAIDRLTSQPPAPPAPVDEDAPHRYVDAFYAPHADPQTIPCAICHRPRANQVHNVPAPVEWPCGDAVLIRDLLAEVQRLKAKFEGNDEHPENRCQECGGRNIVWFAESPEWNRATELNGEDRRELIWCPICFARAAEAKVPGGGWLLTRGEPARLMGLIAEQKHELARLREQLAQREKGERRKLFIWWVCPNGHQYQAPHDEHGTPCPECQREKA